VLGLTWKGALFVSWLLIIDVYELILAEFSSRPVQDWVNPECYVQTVALRMGTEIDQLPWCLNSLPLWPFQPRLDFFVVWQRLYVVYFNSRFLIFRTCHIPTIQQILQNCVLIFQTQLVFESLPVNEISWVVLFRELDFLIIIWVAAQLYTRLPPILVIFTLVLRQKVSSFLRCINPSANRWSKNWWRTLQYFKSRCLLLCCFLLLRQFFNPSF